MASLRWPSIKQALAAFLDHEPNELAVLHHCGRNGGEDAATWDAVRLRHGREVTCFAEAFAACAGPARDRTWATFDLATLAECIPGLTLPAWVCDEMAERAFLDGSGPTDDDDTSARPWAGLHAIPADYDGYVDAEQEAWYQVAAEPPPAPAAPTWDPAILRTLLDTATRLCVEHAVTEVDIVAQACLWLPPPRLPAHAWR